MKNAILGTTALVAVSALAVGNVSASDKIKLELGGYMASTYYFANYGTTTGTRPIGFGGAYDGDQPTSETDTVLRNRIPDRVTHEGEIFFTGSTTLDNGLKFGVNVQLEAYNADDQVDETYIYAEGAFGRVLLGSEDGAAYLMHYASPSPVPMYAADSANISPIAASNGTGGGMLGDSDKITYFTPRVAGFQLGASYVPDASSETGAGAHSVYRSTDLESAGGYDRAYSVAINYMNKLGGVDLAVSAGYNNAAVGHIYRYTGNYKDETSSPNTATGSHNERVSASAYVLGARVNQSEYTLGAKVSYAGVTVGGAYRAESDRAGIAGADKTTWSAAIKYGQGPWSVGAQYSTSENNALTKIDTDVTARPLVTAKSLTNWIIGGQYILGPGVTAFGGVEIYDSVGAGIVGDSNVYFLGTSLSF